MQSGVCRDVLLYHHFLPITTVAPYDNVLTRSLEELRVLPDQRHIYLVFDALDEYFNVSGIQTLRSPLACNGAR